MACKYIIKPKTGPNAGKEVESKLYNDLVDITGSEKSADIVYSQTHHPHFLRKFGNWLSNKGVVSEFLICSSTNASFWMLFHRKSCI